MSVKRPSIILAKKDSSEQQSEEDDPAALNLIKEKIMDEEDRLAFEAANEEDGGMEDVPRFRDNFALKVEGNLISTKHVKFIELPKTAFNGLGTNNAKNEQTNLFVCLFDIGECCENLLKLAKKPKFNFEIAFKQDRLEGRVKSRWKFAGARIKAIDLGQITFGLREQPREVFCEILFDSLTINGVKL
jgi:hypothetical protein